MPLSIAVFVALLAGLLMGAVGFRILGKLSLSAGWSKLPVGMTSTLTPAQDRQVLSTLGCSVFALLMGGAGLVLLLNTMTSSVVHSIPIASYVGLCLISSAGLLILLGLLRFLPQKTQWALHTFHAIRLSLSLGIMLVWSASFLGMLGWGVAYSQGASMLPNLPENRGLDFINVSAYKHANPRPGDVVTFLMGDAQGWGQGGYNKRIVGVPGDKMAYAWDQVWLNGNPLVSCSSPGLHCSVNLPASPTGFSYNVLASPKHLAASLKPETSARVPANEYFVLGDNISVSGDSRLFGTIPRQSIEGRVEASLGPEGFRWLKLPE